MRELKTTYDNSINLIPGTHAETSEIDREFLCKLLQKYKPRKILEVGVSAGGTSALILRNSGNAHLFGVDIKKEWYRDPAKPVGWEVDEICTKEERARYTLLSGRDVIDCMEEIGGDLDFVFLDSAHLIPGELLQFFVVYKYMNNGAILCFHDINATRPWPQGKVSPRCHHQNASTLAFVSIGSNSKIIPDNCKIPHIAALVIDEETKCNLDITFMALGITWYYYPADLIQKYIKFIKANYSSFASDYFEWVTGIQKNVLTQSPK